MDKSAMQTQPEIQNLLLRKIVLPTYMELYAENANLVIHVTGVLHGE